MITLIAAAVAAAAPTAPMPMPSDAHQQHQQQGQMAEMKDCCCKDMMDKMHSDKKMDGMQDHRDHSGK